MDADEDMLAIIMKRAREQGAPIDINYQTKQLTTKWKLINKVFQLIVRAGLSDSDLAMGMAHTEGNTVLHYASQQVRRLHDARDLGRVRYFWAGEDNSVFLAATVRCKSLAHRPCPLLGLRLRSRVSPLALQRWQ